MCLCPSVFLFFHGVGVYIGMLLLVLKLSLVLGIKFNLYTTWASVPAVEMMSGAALIAADIIPAIRWCKLYPARIATCTYSLTFSPLIFHIANFPFPAFAMAFTIAVAHAGTVAHA